MKRPLILFLSFSVMSISSLLAIASHATVDWADGFEYANYNVMTKNWESSCGKNDEVIAPSTDRAHSGSKSLKQTFRGRQGNTPGFQSCYIDRNLRRPSENFYSRFWVFFSTDFIAADSGTKMSLSGEACCYPSFWSGIKESDTSPRQFGVTLQNVVNASTGTTPDNYNVVGGTMPIGQWVCIEMEQRLGTPGVANGVLRAWLDGAETLAKTDVMYRPASTITSPTGGPISSTMQFNLVRLITQDGFGTAYYDDYAVSGDARIGCDEFPPPPPPKGITVK
jgi:hypothetical protein